MVELGLVDWTIEKGEVTENNYRLESETLDTTCVVCEEMW